MLLVYFTGMFVYLIATIFLTLKDYMSAEKEKIEIIAATALTSLIWPIMIIVGIIFAISKYAKKAK